MSAVSRLGMMCAGVLCMLAFTAAQSPPPAASSDRVERIRARGVLTCGVWPEVRGFAVVNGRGEYVGFDTDLCRAVAIAILGPAGRVRFVDTKTVEQFLASPDVDLVSRRLTWSITREGRLGLRFGPVTFYDGQGFMVPQRLGVTTLAQLSGRRVCVDSGSPSEFNLGTVFRERKLALDQVLLEPGTDLAEAFRQGRCEAYTADVTMLASVRAGFGDSGRFIILDELVSKEPLAQVLRQQDERLFDILRWTVFALVDAEELGITSQNIDQMRASPNNDVQRLLGVEPGNGAALGLRESWASDVIAALGNYGELYERHFGAAGAVRLPRGLNRLWTSGGLMFAPPAR